LKSSLTKAAVLPTALCLAAAAYPVAAHHSTAMFEPEKILTLVGTVKEVHWTNPHGAIVIENTSRQGVAPELWMIQLSSPSNLVRSGWTRSLVKPGDKVTATIHPLRDGTKAGALRNITLSETGQSYAYNIRDQDRPHLVLEHSK
jgi:Family of unknown function (DUF6152)